MCAFLEKALASACYIFSTTIGGQSKRLFCATEKTMGAEASKPQGIDWNERAQATQKLLAAQGTPDFFNRERELTNLLQWLSGKPSTVQVVVGPTDSGKTRLLKHLMTLWATDAYLTATSPIFYVDLREQSWRTAADAASNLLAAFQDWADRFSACVQEAGGAVTLRIPGVEIQRGKIMDAFRAGVQSPTDLGSVLKGFTDVVNANPKALPIFILDDANQLKEWPAADVKTLMGCFKSLGKQDERAYLILSTSDGCFRGWLKDMFETGQWRALGVGYFPEEDARQFFTAFCIPAAGGSLIDSLSDADWQDVYKVCGGSPLLLKECATNAVLFTLSWKDAATTLVRHSLSTVGNGLFATVAEEGFEGDKYKKLIQAIVKDKDGCIGVWEAWRKIYGKKSEACKQEIKAMLQGNYIHIRYVWQEMCYADIGPKQDVKEVEFVMARSPAHRVAMEWALEQDDDNG